LELNCHFLAQRYTYPVVVTLEDWYFFGLELPKRLEAAVKDVMAIAGLPLDWLEEMPYSIISIDEFETVAGVVNAVGIRPFISGKVVDPERRFWAYAHIAMIGTGMSLPTFLACSMISSR
jgi:hypothetical protein